jgi:serine/threonine protein kinase
MYMESKRMVHRDIKPKNIMWTGLMGARMIDFGEAVSYDSTTGALDPSAFEDYQDKQQCLPPEAQSSHFNEERDYRKADLYGVGLTFLELLVAADTSTKASDFRALMVPTEDVAPTPKQIPSVPLNVYMDASGTTDLAPKLQALVDGMLAQTASARWTPTKLTQEATNLFADTFATKCMFDALPSEPLLA